MLLDEYCEKLPKKYDCIKDYFPYMYEEMSLFLTDLNNFILSITQKQGVANYFYHFCLLSLLEAFVSKHCSICTLIDDIKSKTIQNCHLSKLSKPHYEFSDGYIFEDDVNEILLQFQISHEAKFSTKIYKKFSDQLHFNDRKFFKSIIDTIDPIISQHNTKDEDMSSTQFIEMSYLLALKKEINCYLNEKSATKTPKELL